MAGWQAPAPRLHHVVMADERQVTVTDNTDQTRFEVRVDGALAGFAAYEVEGSTVALVHTEVFDEYTGAGLAGRLVRRALELVRDAGGTVRPDCSYVQAYMDKHAPEYDDLLAAPAAEETKAQD